MQLADDLPLLDNQGLLLSAGLIPRVLISFYHMSQFIPIVVLSHSDIVLNLSIQQILSFMSIPCEDKKVN